MLGFDNLNYTRRKTLTDYKQKGWLQKDVVERLYEQLLLKAIMA